MTQPPIYLVSGLPRSGTTLLMNLLGQNPAHHVTPNNSVVDLISALRDVWTEFPAFKAQGLEQIKPRIVLTMRGLIEGFYRQEFSAGKVVFDRSTSWLAYMELIEEVLGRPVQVLVTVRDIRAVVASFEKMHRRNPLTSPRQTNYNLSQTVEGRASIALAEDGLIGLGVSRLRDALWRVTQSKIMAIPYNSLCRNPVGVLEQLHRTLGLPSYKYDPKNVKQLTREEFTFNGTAAQDFRSKVELPDESPWQRILPDDLSERINKDFGDIRTMAGGK